MPNKESTLFPSSLDPGSFVPDLERRRFWCSGNQLKKGGESDRWDGFSFFGAKDSFLFLVLYLPPSFVLSCLAYYSLSLHSVLLSSFSVMNDPNTSSTSSGGVFSFKIFGALLENLWKPQRQADHEREVKLLLDAVMLLRPEVLAEGYMLMRAPVDDTPVCTSSSSPSIQSSQKRKQKEGDNTEKKEKKEADQSEMIVDVFSISDPTLSRFLSNSLQGDLICSLVNLKMGLPYVTNNNTPVIR
jgi:hypothetical protein